MFHLYNTLTRNVEPFKPLSQDKVKLYYCGPTVYDYVHIGNLRTYVFEDVVVRALRFLGYKVETTMNITDIDDKTIRGSIEAGLSLDEFTKKYTKLFLADIQNLGIIPADNISPISEVIDEMILMIQGLIDKGFAYKTDDGVYYSIQKFKKYGELANLDMKGMKTSVRINNDEYSKDTPADFALWKGYDATTDGLNKWEAVFKIDGQEVSFPGRPGWHIECSACNLRYFGAQVDIHMGAVDNIFPHHQNEIAQSEAFTGKAFSKYWMHAGHLLVEGKKMSKSAKNFYTLQEIFEKYPSFSKKNISRSFRLLTLTAQYRENFNFLFSSLEAGLKTLEGLDAFLERIRRTPGIVGKVRPEFRTLLQDVIQDFVVFLEDDFNTPEALARVHGFVNDINRILDDGPLMEGERSGVIDMLRSLDSVLAIFDFSKLQEQTIPDDILELSTLRDAAKREKNFALADTYRDQIVAKGYRIVDTKDGGLVEKSE